jgi:hypothetical protein
MIVFGWSVGPFLLVGKAFGAGSLGGGRFHGPRGGFLGEGQGLFCLVRTVLAGSAGGSSHR